MDTRALLHRQAVEELYDDYAPTFEDHLVGKLDYRGPAIIASMIGQFAKAEGPGDLGVVVDLGCGTGLCGAKVRPFASRLIGVDLSEGMLEVAREKELYDELLAADAAVGLSKQPPCSVDHIIAGDVFIYVWSVERVLQACATALRQGGTLTFTTESMEEGECDQGWEERESERFAHSRSFITGACERQGFCMEHCERVELRREPQKLVEKGEEDHGTGGAHVSEDLGSSANDKGRARFLPAEVFVARKL